MTTRRVLDLGYIMGSEGQGIPGDPGAPGKDGSTILHGSNPPYAALGEDKDYYLNTFNGKLYQKVDGAWGDPITTLTLGGMYMGEMDFLSDEYFGVLRKETDNDTRDFFLEPHRETTKSSVLRAIEKNKVVTLTCIRPKTDPYDPENERYHFKNFAGENGPDHHSFGPMLPVGWRPRNDVYFPCDAISANNTRYHGLFRLMPDGSFGAAKLYEAKTGTSRDDVFLSALFFTVTFLAEI